jgi:hypothetical protein
MTITRVNVIDTALAGHPMHYVPLLLEEISRRLGPCRVRIIASGADKLGSALGGVPQSHELQTQALPTSQIARLRLLAAALGERNGITIFTTLDRFIHFLPVLAPLTRNRAVIGYQHRYRRSLRLVERLSSFGIRLNPSRYHFFCPDERLVAHSNSEAGYPLLFAYRDPVYGLSGCDISVELPSPFPACFAVAVLNETTEIEIFLEYLKGAPDDGIPIVLLGKHATTVHREISRGNHRRNIIAIKDRLDDRQFEAALRCASVAILPKQEPYGISSIAIKAAQLGTPIVCYRDTWAGTTDQLRTHRTTFSSAEELARATTGVDRKRLAGAQVAPAFADTALPFFRIDGST